jgi:hypothetical protein
MMKSKLPESHLTLKEFLQSLREANDSCDTTGEVAQVQITLDSGACWVALNGKDFADELGKIIDGNI